MLPQEAEIRLNRGPEDVELHPITVSEKVRQQAICSCNEKELHNIIKRANNYQGMIRRKHTNKQLIKQAQKIMLDSMLNDKNEQLTALELRVKQLRSRHKRANQSSWQSFQFSDALQMSTLEFARDYYVYNVGESLIGRLRDLAFDGFITKSPPMDYELKNTMHINKLSSLF